MTAVPPVDRAATERRLVWFTSQELADELRRRGDDHACPVGCGSGACETCPCCGAGWCVYGLDGLPESPDDFAQWLEIAAEHNALAAGFQALLRADHGITS